MATIPDWLLPDFAKEEMKQYEEKTSQQVYGPVLPKTISDEQMGTSGVTKSTTSPQMISDEEMKNLESSGNAQAPQMISDEEMNQMDLNKNRNFWESVGAFAKDMGKEMVRSTLQTAIRTGRMATEQIDPFRGIEDFFLPENLPTPFGDVRIKRANKALEELGFLAEDFANLFSVGATGAVGKQALKGAIKSSLKTAGKELPIIGFAGGAGRALQEGKGAGEVATEGVSGAALTTALGLPLATVAPVLGKMFSKEAKQISQSGYLSEALEDTRQVLNPSKAQINKVEIKQGKNFDDTLELLLEEKFKPQVHQEKIYTVGEVDRLQGKKKAIDKIVADNLDNTDQKTDLLALLERVTKEIENGSDAAIIKKQKLVDAAELIDSEIEFLGRSKVTDLELHTLKNKMWSVGFDMNRQTLSPTARKLGRMMKEVVQENTPDYNIKGLNELSGRYADAISLLESSNGNIIKGGRLGGWFYRLLVGQIMQNLLGKVPGIGNVSYALGQFIGKNYNDFLNDPIRVMEGAIKKAKKAKIEPQSAKILDDFEKQWKSIYADELQTKLKRPKVEFEQAKGLSPEDQVLEEKAFNKISQSGDEIVANYLKGNKVVNTDDLRKVFIDEGYAGYNSAAFQEPASYLSKKAFAKGLENPEPLALLYAGGSGSGKTSALKNIPEITKLQKESAVISDGNLSSYSSAIKRITEAKNAGKKVSIVYVYREPVEAFEEGVIKRMLDNPDEMGRVVPSEVVAGNHLDSWKVVTKLYEEGYDVRFVDNSLGRGKAKEVSFEELNEKIKYPSKEDLTGTFNQIAEGLAKREDISPEQLKGYLGGEEKNFSLQDTDFNAIIDGLESGGITFDMIKKSSVGGEPLIAVSPFPERSLIVKSKPTKTMLADYIEKNMDLLEKKGFALGGWYDKESGQTFIDLTVMVPKTNQQQALELAKVANQKAGFDLENFVEISTGGTGETIEGMISYEERLKMAENALSLTESSF